MRYRDKGAINQIDGEITPIIADEMLILTAILGLIIGIIFVVGGYYGKQLWIVVWGSGLVLASIIFLTTFLSVFR